MAVHEGRFSGPSYDTLAEGKVRGAISFVSQIFRENDRPNPTKDEDGDFGRVISRQYRAFKKSDPNPAQQNPSQSVPLLKSSKRKQQRLNGPQAN